MYCSRLSVLKELLSETDIEKIEIYFSSLIGSAKTSITVSKVVEATNIPANLVIKALTKCKENGLLDVAYSIRCPNCEMLIKKVSTLAEIPNEPFECYNCEEEVEIQPEFIEVIYSLVDDDCVFIDGQQNDSDTSARSVAPENSMAQIFQAGGINEYLFHPTDDQYSDLSNLYSRVVNASGKKEKGDTLEHLTAVLFNLCTAFNAAGMRTSTNQIDCFVRNKLYLDYGILRNIGARFYIECKNENTTPSGSYISKLHSIISTTNASSNGECIRFGIIVSKKSAPKTFKAQAVKYYLSQKIVIIAICGKEIKQLIDQKGNLLELIERKATEIMVDSTSDLVQAGLYDI